MNRRKLSSFSNFSKRKLEFLSVVEVNRVSYRRISDGKFVSKKFALLYPNLVIEEGYVIKRLCKDKHNYEAA